MSDRAPNTHDAATEFARDFRRNKMLSRARVRGARPPAWGRSPRAMKSEIGRKGVYERDVEPKKGHLEPKPPVSPQNTLKHHQMNVEER